MSTPREPCCLQCCLVGGQGSEGDGCLAAHGRHLQVLQSFHLIPSFSICRECAISQLFVCRQNPKFGDAAKFQGELEAAILRVQVDK